MSVETFKGEMSKFHSLRQAEGGLYTEFGEASRGGRFPVTWKLLASDRLLPRYTFPHRRRPDVPLRSRTAFGWQMR